tara:strand:+ start:5741 stop:6073 length:333 start_codon:yes stop_codon:yes gene_type:complete
VDGELSMQQQSEQTVRCVRHQGIVDIKGLFHQPIGIGTSPSLLGFGIVIFQIREKVGYLLQFGYALQRTIVQFSIFLEQATKNELPRVPAIADVEPVEHCPMFRASMWVF